MAGAANKTPILQLNQWLGTEYVTRAGFNEDNANLETWAATVARSQMFTALGGIGTEDGAGTWAKLATIVIPEISSDVDLILAIIGSGHGTITGSGSAIINARVRYETITPTGSVDISILSKSGTLFDTNSFKIVTDDYSTFELWVKKTEIYSILRIYELGFNQYQNSGIITVTYHDDAAWQSTTPTGTYSAQSDGIVTDADSVLAALLTVDGTGSGLDADKLDGQEGSYYLPVSSYTASDVLAKIKTVDGDGSGLDADNLAGIPHTSFLRSDTGDTFSGGSLIVQNDAGIDITNTGQINGLQIQQPTAEADALISFHVSGDFALHFGLDGETNDLAVGGWSMGANKHKIWHAGNDGAGSGLDADKLDGIQGSQFLRSDVADIKTAGNLTFNDNISATFGTSNDFGIYHDGTNNIFRSYKHGAQTTMLGENESGALKTMMSLDPDNSVNLYYTGTLRAHTHTSGFNVIGDYYNDGQLQANTRVNAGKLQYYDAGWKDVGMRIKQTIRGIATIGLNSTSTIVTIPAIIMLNTQVRFLGAEGGQGDTLDDIQSIFAKIELISTTQLQATRGNDESTIYVSYEITEYYA